MTKENLSSIKLEIDYISEKGDLLQNVVESCNAVPKIEGPNLELTGKHKEGQVISEHILKVENKTFLKYSIHKGTELISVLDNDWEMFECNQCEKKYNSRSARYTHKKKVHLGIVPEYIVVHCDQCAFTTKRKDHLKDHIKNIHEKICCDLCGKEFSFRSLIDHKTVVHEGIKNHCNQCGSNFSTKGNLVAHKAVHVEGRRYVCNQCGRGFLRKPTLDGHMRSKHNTEGRLQCQKCEKSFASRRAILLHAQSKHDKIKFKCDKCSHQSSQLGNLKTHIKK